MISAKTNIEAYEWGSAARGGQACQSTDQSGCALVVEEANRK